MSVIHKPFYFMRHGQTDWNADNKRMGQRDVPLNDHGKLQAQVMQSIVAGIPATHVFYSPMARAHETMKIATELLACEKIVHDLLREWHLGDWEGTDRVMENEDFPPGGETKEDFFNRSLAAINHILNSSEVPLVVGHSGTFLALKRRLDLNHLPKISNCEIAYFMPPKGERTEWFVQIIAVRLPE